MAAGGYLALCQFGGVFGRLFWGMASDRLFGGRRGVVLSLIGALSVVMMVAMGLLGPGSSLWLLGTITFVAGSCAIGWNAVGHTLISELAGPKYAATAVGFNLAMLEIGTLLGPPGFGLVADLAAAYRPAWFLLAAVMAAGTLVAILATRGERRLA